MTVSTSRNKKGVVNADFMAEQLYWVALDCTGIPNEMVTEYTSHTDFYIDTGLKSQL